jgi:hypothetical protein
MNNDRITYITIESVNAAHNTLSKTKWNKIMFFSDLAFYTCDNLEYANKIYTGLDYIKMPYGPVVDNYNNIIAKIAENNNLEIKSYFGIDSNISQYIELRDNISININIPQFEKLVIFNVIKKFIDFTASKLSSYSHLLSIWKAPNMYSYLNFEYAHYDKYKINEDFIGTFYQLIMS